MVALTAATIAAWVADERWGDPAVAWHPVRLFGLLSEKAAGLLLRCPLFPRKQKYEYYYNLWETGGGILLVGFMALGPAFAVWLFLRWIQTSVPPPAAGFLFWAISAAILWACVADRDMRDHARKVQAALGKGRKGLPEARRMLSRIVGRRTDRLSDPEIRRACVESVAEGYLDGLLGPLFWFVLLGAPGAVLYRAVNTLDSMFGYRWGPYHRFGWSSARLDDILNWIPARLSPVLAGLASLSLPAAFRRGGRGRTKMFWNILIGGYREGGKNPSPNAGYPQAAFAWALGCRLGGRAVYPAGRVAVAVEKPQIGPTGKPTASHLSTALALHRRAAALAWLSAALVLFLLAGRLPLAA